MTQANNPTGKAIAGFLGAVVVAVAAAGGAYAYTTRYAHVATVNGERIAMGTFQRRLSGLKQQYAQQMGVNFHNEAGKAVLDDLHAKVIDRLMESTLIQQEAAKRGIVVNAETIDKEFDQIVQASFGGDRKKLAERLRQLHMTEDDAREQVADGQYAKGLMASIAGSDRMTEAQALDYYNKNRGLFERDAEVKASHILVPTLEEAKKVQQELAAGTDFGELAKTYSKDPGSAANGGDLGFFGKGRMVKPFEETAFALKEGQVSEPVKSQFGYHIIKVTDRHAGGLAAFETVKDQIIEQNDKERHQEAFRKWLDEAKKKATVHYAAGYAPKVSAESRPPADDGHNH